MTTPAPGPHPPQNPQDTLDRLRAGALAGATRLDLRGCGLGTLPPEVLGLADTLQALDLSDNALTDLPAAMAGLHRLQVLFASGNPFSTLPPVLGRCPALQLIGFKACRITTVPTEALPPTLRWLILTDNRIDTLILDVLVRKHRLIRATLEHVTPNRSEAARLLGISRRALHYKIRQLGLDHEAPRAE